MTTCKKCGKEKSADRYVSARRMCKDCVRAYQRQYYAADPERGRAATRRWRAANPELAKARESAYSKARHAANPEISRDRQLKKNYGLTLQEWGVMLGKQEGLCAICSDVLDRGRHTHVDHDHDSGKVRALLCGPCNKGIGHFKDNAENLVLAAKYIQDHAVRAVA